MLDFPIYSPIEPVHWFDTSGVRVFMKRDDKIHPFISGNKWRKLKYLLQRALRENKNHLVTFGGAYSNHLLATACAGALFGFKTTGFIRGEETLPINDTLFLCKQFGMQLIYIDRETYKNKQTIFCNYFESNAEAFFINEGGASEEAEIGCAELIDELNEKYDYIVLACGTGSTMAGIVRGCYERNYASNIEGVCVHKGISPVYDCVKKSSQGLKNWHVHEDFHLGGYAKTSADFLNWIYSFQQKTGILLDPIYTGKMMYALHHLIKQNYFPQGSSVLTIHTGGLLGTLGMKNRFEQIVL